MARPSKLSPTITKKIGDNIALGLICSLASESVGITYQTFNSWMNKGEDREIWEILSFYKHITKRNADAAKALLERLNDAAKDENCQVCMWMLERRFSDEFGRRVYRKINAVSENKNENVEITVHETDLLIKQILAKLDMF